MKFKLYVDAEHVADVESMAAALDYIHTEQFYVKYLEHTGADVFCETPNGSVFRYESPVQGEAFWRHEGNCPECGCRYVIVRLPDGTGFGPICQGEN